MKSTATALLLLLVLAGACGDDARPLPGGSRTAEALPDLPPVDDRAKAHFALERLLRGPLPRTGAFGIPKIHQLNLEHSRDDLVALGPATLEILSDPELIARLTRPDDDHNPWHNVLQVLGRMEHLPAELVTRWCRPALDTNDLQLDRHATRALLAADDAAAVAPLMLALLERRARDRELVPIAFRALAQLGDPWRARALDASYREGTALHWGRVPALLGTATSDAAPTADALAWWALLADLSGPLEMRGSSRSVSAPWFEGRLLMDDAVWPREPVALAVAVEAGRVLAPATVVDAGGALPESTMASPVLPWRQLLLSGRGSAADARCRLAEAGHATFLATVQRDLEASDPLLLLTAEQCPARPQDPEASLETARIVLDAFVADLESEAQPSSTGVAQALRLVLTQAPDAGVGAAVRILRHARPQGRYQGLIEAAHDLLRDVDADALAAEIASLLRSGDELDRATGLLLVRRGRDVRLAPVLDELLAQATPADAALLQRLLIWVYSGPGPLDPQARDAFAARYAEWITSAPDAEARVLAPGLLDLGGPGAAAYAAGLSGPRRVLYVDGLLGRSSLVPYEVAEALLAPVDPTTSPGERRAVLVAAYRVAPTDAAPLLAALRQRIAAGDRAEVDDVLAVVRHRATR